VENLNVSAFHGLTPNRFQALVMVTWLTFSSAASSRDDQPGRRRRQRRGHNPARIHHLGPARPILISQPVHARLDIAGPPPVHRRPRHPDPLGDLGIPDPLRSQQHDPRPLRQGRPHRPRPHQTGQPFMITNPQQQRRSTRMRHTPSSHAK
jgi:hypothetical protein